MAVRDIWRSKRLIYRPTEQTDEPFLASINSYGSEGFRNATLLLPVPQGPRGATQYREHMQKALLGCAICLPPPATTPPTTTAPNSTPDLSTQPIPIGTISLRGADEANQHHRNTMIGLNICVPYQGQGYGSEAILWVLEWAFRHANMHRVGIAAFAWNEGAWKLYERLGFVMEGRKRESVWYEGGYRDEVELGMLEGEWMGRYGRGEEGGEVFEERVGGNGV